MGRPYNDPIYKKNRGALLAGHPPCTYCGKPATEADHIIPVQMGGDNSLDNLTPACKICNSRRGNRQKQAQNNARIAAREQALRAHGLLHDWLVCRQPGCFF